LYPCGGKNHGSANPLFRWNGFNGYNYISKNSKNGEEIQEIYKHEQKPVVITDI